MSDEPTTNLRHPGDGPEPTDVLAPTRLVAGKYRLGRLLGEGGMGSVYEGEHVELGARVAVKLLSEHYATQPVAARRARREARAMASIRHDNIVTVMDTGTDDGIPYIVMELLEGESLNGLLRRERKLPSAVAAAIAQQILDGVAAAHAQGVVHRDLKPGNVFVTRDSSGEPRVKILDFGISKVAGEEAETALTATGAMLGTPLYMAPEQVRGEVDVDGRTDLYAVGVLLYRMVTGVTPGASLPAPDRQAAILAGALPSPREVTPELGEALERVIQKAMAVEPGDRFQDAHGFQRELLAAVPEAAEALAAMAPTVATGGDASSAGAGAPAMPVDSRLTIAARRRRRRLAAAGVGSLLAAVAAVVLWQTAGGGARSGGEEATTGARAGAGPGAGAAAGTSGGEAPLRIGMTTYVPAEVQERIYGPIARHIGERLDRPVELAIYHDSEELAQRFFAGDVAVAALNPVSYVAAKQARPGLELLATPVTAGGSSFEVYIVSRADGDHERLEDLRGSIFCYVPSAASGYLFPRDMLRKAGLHPDEDFSATRFADDHVSALRHVASGRCAATAVYAGLFFQLDEQGLSPQSFRILATSERIPNDAYCASDTLPAETIARAREALLELAPGSEPARRVFGSGHELTGFAPATDEAYERVRAAVAREEAAE